MPWATIPGNVVSATLAAVIALYIAEAGVFYLVGVMALGMIVSIAFIPGKEIDTMWRAADWRLGRATETIRLCHLARRSQPWSFSPCVSCCSTSPTRPLLPLVSQKLSVGSDAEHGTAFTSACIIAAQIVMGLMAWLCGRTADSWGRKPLFIVAFAVMPIREILFSLGDDPVYLVAVQALDGSSNGVFGVMFLLIVADLTRGTGRFNIVQGAFNDTGRHRASMSTLIAEEIVELFNYAHEFPVPSDCCRHRPGHLCFLHARDRAAQTETITGGQPITQTTQA